jgi:hypothetical protein
MLLNGDNFWYALVKMKPVTGKSTVLCAFGVLVEVWVRFPGSTVFCDR